MVDVAEINIWEQLVGAVRWNSTQNLASFQYDPIFLQNGWEISPLKMPLSQGNRIYTFPNLRKGKNDTVDTFKGLPGLLADTLPDRYGNQLINIWLAQNGRLSESMNPVEQLCFIGARGMGALEFEPAQFNSTKAATIEISGLVDVAAKMLQTRYEFKTNLQKDEEKALKEILKIGTSAGGARPKALIAYNPQTGEVKSGQSTIPEGFEHWLIKLDGVSDAQFGPSNGWGRVEYAYHLMAKASGIQMSACQLLEDGKRAHFMTKRFDRAENNTKHHIQTWCGIAHYDYNNLHTYSYEQMFETMRELKLTYPEAEQMFRRMVFNVLATNCDDHTKNFGFRLRQGKKWELAPAYDVCYAYDAANIWVNQQTLSINGKYKDIVKQDFMTIANSNSIKKGEKIVEEINHTIKNWGDFAIEANVDNFKQKEIESNLHFLN